MPLAFLLGLALLGSSARAAAPEAHAPTLIYSNDVLGEIEPCGCRSNPLGGMQRKANLVKSLAGTPLLQLDGGDLLFETDVIPPALRDQAALRASYLLRALDMLHHDAVVPGEKDFALGIEPLQKLLAHAKVKFLAANLKRANGQPLFKADAIFELPDATRPSGKLRVAVLGLVGEKLRWPKGLKAESVIATAKRLVPGLRAQADLVIALVHEGFEADQALAGAVPGIDLIVGGHSQTFLQTPPRVGQTYLYQSSFRNQYVGLVPLAVPFKNAGHKMVGLDPGYDDPGLTDPSAAVSPMQALVNEYKAAVAQMNSAAITTLTQLGPNGEQPAKFQTFARCAECHLKQFDFWRKTPHADALHALVAKGQGKDKECLRCHSVGLGDPQGFSEVGQLAERRRFSGSTGEVKALEPLPLEDFHAYLESLHQVKSLDDEVKIRRDDSKGLPLKTSLGQLGHTWSPVQCENCHLPGRDHPFGASASAKYVKTVDSHTCLSCHTPERAPEWYTQERQPDWDKIAKKRASITCPAGDLK